MAASLAVDVEKVGCGRVKELGQGGAPRARRSSVTAVFMWLGAAMQRRSTTALLWSSVANLFDERHMNRKRKFPTT
jgi:hypothetical protein